MTTPTLGHIVNFTTATGNVVTAQVVCTESSYSPGRYVNRMSPDERREAIAGTREGDRYPDGINAVRLDGDGDEWIASPVPAPKSGRVHLAITAPNGSRYVEYNVAEDDQDPEYVDTPGTPGTWHYPPRVDEDYTFTDEDPDFEDIEYAGTGGE